MVKKVTILLIVFALTMSSAFAESITTETCLDEVTIYSNNYKSAYGLIKAICPQITENLKKGEVSRADFVSKLYDLLKMPVISSVTSQFTDVQDNNPVSKKILLAASLGWVSADKKFNPDATIKVKEAYTVAVNALNYKDAALRSGEWPFGHMKIANRLHISDNITSGDKLDDENMMIMFKNILCVTYNIDNTKVIYDEGATNYLESLYGVYNGKGIVNATKYNSLKYGVKMENRNTIEINGEEYTYDKDFIEDDIWDLLGYHVEYYYHADSSEKKILYIQKTRRNSIKRLEHADYTSFDSGSVNYEENGKSRSCRIADNCIMVVNGRCVKEFNVKYFDKNGYTIFIDNNNDGFYDVAQVNSFDYLQVSYVDRYNSKIGDTENETNSLDLSKNIDNKTYWIKNEDGDELSIYNLKIGSVLEVRQSADKELCRVNVLKTVSGVIEQIDDKDGYYINETKYVTSEYFNKYYSKSTPLGSSGTFAIGYNDTLVCPLSIKVKYKYGFLIKCAIDKKINATLKLKIYDDTGIMSVYSVAKKCMLDGVKNVDTNQIVDAITESGVTKEIVIRYALNAEGEIYRIDTPADYDENQTDTIKNPDDSLTYYPTFKTTKMMYRQGRDIFNGYFGCKGTTVMRIPNDLDASESFYQVGSANMLLVNGGDYYPDVYDIDVDTGCAAVAVVRGMDSYMSKTDTYVVEKTFIGIDEDGTSLQGIVCWKEGVFYKYLIDESVVYSRDVKSSLQPGDIIRVKLGPDSKIQALVVDFNYSKFSVDSSLKSNSYQNPTAGISYWTGVPYSGKGNYIRLMVEKDDFEKWNNSILKSKVFSVITSNNIVKFDCVEKKLRPIGIDEIKTEEAFGDDADFMVLLQDFDNAHMIVVYDGYRR